MTGTSHTGAMSAPPEGALAGETVPPGSEPDAFEESVIQRVMAEMKARGEPYTEMSEHELRERALELLQEAQR